MNRTHARTRAEADARPRLRDPFRLEWNGETRAYEVILPLGRIELNRSAGEILMLCDGTRELDDIIAELETRFAMHGLAADVYRFIDQARCFGWFD
jgi:pyrroloquinoline quinone biosynthesis protein D